MVIGICTGALENQLLKKQIELLEKSWAYRCPAGETGTPNDQL